MTMKLNIRELTSSPESEIPFAFTADAESLELTHEAVEFVGGIDIKGTVVFTGHSYRVAGEVRDTVHYACDRCLRECEEQQVHELAEDYPLTASTDDDYAAALEGDWLDIEPLVRDTLIAAQPISHLCRPDCRGLCPVCGHDLNEGECGCDRTVIDPRMAALKALLNNDDI